MNAPAVDNDQAEINKNHPIFEFLKSIPDDVVKEYTKKLGKNNLRNFNSMRSFLAKSFFDLDKNTPLESLKKFIRGELPELDVTLKVEPTKRKSESRSGLNTKKAKTDLATVNENQENLKNCRKMFLDSIAKKQGLGEHLIDNPILDKAVKYKEIMTNWNREEPCKICKESWFDQDNATRGKNIGVCQRCRNDKEKEIPMFSEMNEMIPGPLPDYLKDLNEIEKGAIRQIIPYITMFKNKAGGRGSSGHSISFYQDIGSFAQTLPKSLPRPIEDLQIILIKTSKGKKKEFKANATKIRAALVGLIADSDDYRDIKIDEENLAQYDADIELPTVEEAADEKAVNDTISEQTNSERHPFENEDEILNMAYEEYVESLGDIPKATHTVNENIATDTIDNYVKKAIEELQVGNDEADPEKIPWPEQGEEPVSDFTYGYFSKAFPHLFPNGMADITKTRPGKKPTMKQWLQHLLKVDRRFAQDPQFILIVTNMMQKKKALALGNLYVDKCLEGTNLDEIMKKLKGGG